MEIYDEKIVQDVIAGIRECINDRDLEVKLSSRLAEDLNVDSVDAICFIMELEDLYDVEIEDERIETFTDVASIVRLIQEVTKKGT